MAGYTRQRTITDGNTIAADLFNGEYNQIVNAFSNTTGHKHDGTAAEGPVIGLIGDAGLATPLNKIIVDTTNDHLEFYVDVSGSAVEQLKIQDGAIVPVTDNDIDLGTSSLEFKDLYVDGVAYIDALGFGSTSMTLPTSAGSANQFLQTDGSGTLSFGSAASVGKAIAMAIVFG